MPSSCFCPSASFQIPEGRQCFIFHIRVHGTDGVNKTLTDVDPFIDPARPQRPSSAVGFEDAIIKTENKPFDIHIPRILLP